MNSKQLQAYLNFTLQVMVLSSFIVFAGCAKKPSGMRTFKQTGAIIFNESVSKQSQSIAQQNNTNYELISLSFPESSNGQNQIISEVKTPSGKYIDFSTTHQSGTEAYGLVDDSENNAKLDIRAKCNDSQCSTYYLLITVVKNNYAVHQLAATSFSTDCKFNLETINPYISNLYRSLDEMINKMQSSLSPRNDRNTCLN